MAYPVVASFHAVSNHWPWPWPFSFFFFFLISRPLQRKLFVSWLDHSTETDYAKPRLGGLEASNFSCTPGALIPPMLFTKHGISTTKPCESCLPFPTLLILLARRTSVPRQGDRTTHAFWLVYHGCLKPYTSRQVYIIDLRDDIDRQVPSLPYS